MASMSGENSMTKIWILYYIIRVKVFIFQHGHKNTPKMMKMLKKKNGVRK